MHTHKQIKRLTLLAIMLFTSCLCLPSLGLASGSTPSTFKAGVRMLAAWDSENGEGVEFALWYPSTKAESTINLGEWQINAGRDGKEMEGKFPLIFISHDSGANKLSYHDTAAQLARAGFVVAAPTHNADNTQDMSGLFSAEQIFNRPSEIKLIIDHLKQDEFKSFVDTDKIGILGIGPGASSALILAGGVVDISSYTQYCENKPASNVYCSNWAKQRLTTLSFYLPQSPDFEEPNIKALVLAMPAFSMLFTKESLTKVKCPTLIYKGENDTYDQAEDLKEMLSNSPELTILPNMDSRTLTAACPPSMLLNPTWQCSPDSEDKLSERELLFNSNLIKFFSQELYTNTN